MANTYEFAQVKGSSIAFDLVTDSLHFDNSYQAADLIMVQFGADVQLQYGSQTLRLLNTTLGQLKTTHFAFADGSQVLLGDTTDDSLSGGDSNDLIMGHSGNDTLDGGSGINVVRYAGSEYDYIVTRQNDGSVTVRAIAGTPTEADGTDTLKNIQVIRFTDGGTERVLDDVASQKASSNRVVQFGEEITGQVFVGDQDWFQVIGGQAGQKVLVTLSGDNGNTVLTVPGSGLSLNANNGYLGASGEVTLDANGGLSIEVLNNALGVNAIGNYRFTVLTEMAGTDAADTLNVTGYIDAKGGNDSLQGSANADYLQGGLGSDTLIGGAGNDTLVGGDEADDKDIAVFSGRFADYVISNSDPNNTTCAWWVVSGPEGTDYLTGIETLRFADRDYVIDDYDTFTGADIAGRPSYGHLGEQIQGRFTSNFDSDWITFDFGRGVVDKTTTLKVTITSRDNAAYYKNLTIINVSGQALQFTDLSNNTKSSNFNLDSLWGTREYLIKGIQWGENAEGGAFGGNQAFLVMNSSYGSHNFADPDQGNYSISISRYRQGTAGDDVLTTDGATAQQQVEELAGLAGNDQLTGTDRAERFDGGDGNDEIRAGAGNDQLQSGAGNDSLYGEAGDDQLIITGKSTVNDLLDGGTGTDSLQITSDVNLTAASISSIENLVGNGQRVTVSASQLAGFTSASGVIFSGNQYDLKDLSGNFSLEGTIGDDVLKGGNGDNLIRPFAGNNTIDAGAGNDTVLWERGYGYDWSMRYTGNQLLSNSTQGDAYLIKGTFDGGAGTDTLEFRLNDNIYHDGLGYWWTDQSSRQYALDLSQATINHFESIKLISGRFGNNGMYSYGPSAIYLTASQLAQMQSLSGANFIVKGGGVVNLGAIQLNDGATLSVTGDDGYNISGTSAADAITSYAGNDTIDSGSGKDTLNSGGGNDQIHAGADDDVIIISSKSTVLDTLDGGEGNDILRITGSDVDLSAATLSGIENIEANSSSLALTQAQYDQYQTHISGKAGLILKMTAAGSADITTLPNAFVGIRGTAGDDTLLGGSKADLLVGDAGNDSLVGGDGDDRLVGGIGINTVLGGAGNDTLDVSGLTQVQGTLDGGEGTDTLRVTDGVDLSAATLQNIEVLSGTGKVKLTDAQLAAIPTLDGVTAVVDTGLMDLAITHTLKNGASIQLGSGEHTVQGTSTAEVLTGGTGRDTLIGHEGADTLNGGAGDDQLEGDQGDDHIDGGAGYNTLVLSGQRSDYQIPSAAKLDANGFTVKLQQDAIDGGNTDGNDVVANVQSIVFAGETDPSLRTQVLDDYSNAPDVSNTSIEYGKIYKGVLNYRNDADYFRLATVKDQSVQVALNKDFYREGLIFSQGTPVGDVYQSNGFGGGSGLIDVTMNQTGVQDLGVLNWDWNGSGSRPLNYSFVLRRNWTGTDGADYLEANGQYEHLMSGAGNDTLMGGNGLDSIEAGSGDDSLYGGAGDDVFDGGTGINTVRYDGNRGDYDLTYIGGGSWQINHRNQGSDGIDILRNMQNVQFADQTVVLDDYSNGQDSAIKSSSYGQMITGAAQFDGDSDWFQFDFGKWSASAGKTLKITLEGGGPGQRFHITDADGNELYFKDAQNQDVVWLYSGQSMILKPDRWGADPDGPRFVGGKGWVQLYANGAQATGTQYILSIARYLEGTANDDTLGTDGKYDELNGLAGNDTLNGGATADRLFGSEGDDSLSGAAGNDYLSGGSGSDSVLAGEGDDTIDVTGQGTVTDSIDGGVGNDTLLINQGVNLNTADISHIEVISSNNGGSFSFSPTQLSNWGVNTLNNLDWSLSSAGTLNASAINGNYGLQGSTGDDELIAGAGNNLIRPLAGKVTVDAGAGDDRIMYQPASQDWISSDQTTNNFLSADDASQSYRLQGTLDGGAGIDSLEFAFNYWWHWNNWAGYGSPYSLDLSQAQLNNLEKLQISGPDWGNNLPAYVTLTVSQLQAFQQLIGIKGVKLVGGGAVDLGSFAAKGGVNLNFADNAGYTLTGTANVDEITDTTGNDQLNGQDGNDKLTTSQGVDTLLGGNGDDLIIVSGKTLVTDAIDGGEGNDTLRITGSDVDLSAATLSGIENIEANSSSLALTQAQYDQYQTHISGKAGLILKMTAAGSADITTLPNAFVGIRGTAGDDTLLGGSKADLLVGDAGNDSLVGGDGDDRLVGGIGINTVLGGAGNDTLDVSGLTQVQGTLDGGEGTNTLRVTDGVDLSAATLQNIDVLSGTGKVKLTDAQLAAIPTLDGVTAVVDTGLMDLAITHTLKNGASIQLGSGEHTVQGTSAAEVLTGGTGRDTLIGHEGADTLNGGTGNDQLEGGQGDDHIDGGAGYNTLVLSGQRSDYQIPSAAKLDANGFTVKLQQDAIDAGNTDGNDVVANVQGIVFAGETDPSLRTQILDDYSNASDQTNILVDYGKTYKGVLNYRNDSDFFRLATVKDQSVQVTFNKDYYYQALAFSQGNQFAWGTITGDVVINQTGIQDISIIYNGDWNWSGSRPLNYSFVLRRNWTGTDGADYLEANGQYEHLMSGAGNDTLMGGNGLDSIEAGSGDDSLYGGAGDDVFDGGTGINTVRYDGNRGDYDLTYIGGGSWQINHRNQGSDGIDILRNMQNVQFADQTVVLDDYSNGQDSAIKSSSYGQMITGAAQFDGDSDWFQFDFGKWSASAGKTLKITLEGGGPGQRFHITDADGNELYFKDAQNQDVVWLYSGQSMILKPDRWGADPDGPRFVGGKGWVQLYANGAQATGTQYILSIARYLEGTANDDTLGTDGKYDELNGLAGNDTLNGGATADRLFGSEGDDSLSGAAGNDYLSGGSGSDSVLAGEGDDTIDVTGQGTVTDSIDGGVGNDTLLINQGVNLNTADISHIEVISSNNGGSFSFSPTQLSNWGVNTLNNLDWSLSSAGTLNASAINGNYGLQGSTGDDELIAGAGNNLIRPLAGKVTVDAGAGDDRIMYQPASQDWISSDQTTNNFLSADDASQSYRLQGTLDGGAGIDSLEFAFNYWWHWNNWAGYGSPYSLDLSQAQLNNLEKLQISGPDWGNNLPAYVTLTVSQLQAFQQLIGIKGVKLVGGGAVDLGSFAAKGGVNLNFADNAGYTLTGTANVDEITDTTGNDQLNGQDGNDKLTTSQGVDTLLGGNGDDLIIVSGKTLVTDAIDGGEGTDTLRITGSDVDLSGAKLNSIESIRVASSSLSLTADQWASYPVSRIGGATTQFLLSMIDAGTASLAEDAVYTGITGSMGDDTLMGNASDNRLLGSSGNDALFGGAGNDRLTTGSGLDSLIGGDGNDILIISDKVFSRDTLDGGVGTDTLQVTGPIDLSTAVLSSLEVLDGTGTVTMTADQLNAFSEIKGVTVQLTATVSPFALLDTRLSNGAKVLLPGVDSTLTLTDGILGTKNDDSFSGGRGNDVLYGGRGADTLNGVAGNDTLIGGSGVDSLLGGVGDDLIRVDASEFSSWANVGSDIVDGGVGNDELEINYAAGGSYGSRFVIANGAVKNVETLRLNAVYYNFLQLDVSTFRQFSALTTTAVDSYWAWLKIELTGDGGDLNLNSISAHSQIDRINLLGQFGAIDASQLNLASPTADINYGYISVSALDSIQLGSGNDKLIVSSDNRFVANLGSGDDVIKISSVRNLNATLNGNDGNDTLNLAENSLIDISNASISNIESIQYGNASLILSQQQFDSLSLDGSGAKFIRAGNLIKGTSGNDSFSGEGRGAFQGGSGDDFIANINTAVFSGNYADYDFVRSGSGLTIQHARGSLADGTDYLAGVMNLQFADTSLAIDDAPNDDPYRFLYSKPVRFIDYVFEDLSYAEYGKRMSARKDFNADNDVFRTNLAPNSPLAIDASSENGSGWIIYFVDVVTGQALQFKSLVYGLIYDRYFNSFTAEQKWLPGFDTADGFKPYQGGQVALLYNLADGVQNYAFTLNYLDDYAGSVDTLGQMDPLIGEVRGYIGDVADSDWIRTSLIAGTKYEFQLKGESSGGGTLVDPKLQLLDDKGRVIESGLDLAANFVGNDDQLVFRPTVSGDYYLSVTDVALLNTGSWTLTQKSLDTIPGNVSSSERIDWNDGNNFSVTSEINALSDHDWFKIWLDKGLTYNFRLLGSSDGKTLTDPQLSLRSVTGILLSQDDNSGGGNDAKVIYTAADSGWYFLDAGASGNAGKGTYTLKGSTLADDYANTLLTTGVVQFGSSVQGLVSYNGDSDWFKVGLSKGKVYVIDLVGDTSDSAQLDPLIDPFLVIRDASGKVLTTIDDFAGSLNARAYFTATADGIYYLEAKSAFKYDVGAYKLSVSGAPADDYADIPDNTASALALGVAGQSGVIGIPGDKDVFSMSLDTGKVYQLNVTGLGSHDGTLVDPYLRLFNSNGRVLDFDNNSGTGNDAQLYFSPTSSGTYYLEASANNDRGMGTYKVSVIQRDMPADDVANDLSTNKQLIPGDSFYGNLLTHNDQDWFAIDLLANNSYVFRTRAADSGNGTLLDPVMEIHAADGSLVRSIDNMLISHEPATAFVPTSSGRYYLVVKAADGQTDTGSYTLITRAPDDYANTKPDAQLVQLNQSYNGGIQWADGAFGIRAYDSVGLATDFDEDWFKFTADKDQLLSVNVKLTTGSSLSRPMVEVVDEQGRSLALGDGLETKDGLAVASFKAPDSGTYYARVIDGAGTTGNYQFSLTLGDASDEDAQSAIALDFISNGAITQAEYTARIGLSGDSDRFSIALQQNHHYRFETLAVRDGQHTPLSSAALSLNYLAQGETVATPVEISHDAAAPSFFDTTLYDATSSGTMQFSVQPLDSTHTGVYKVRVVDLGANLPDDRPDAVEHYVDAIDGVQASNDNVSGRIDSIDDVDLFAINLTAGNLYDFSVKAYVDGLGTLANSQLRLLDASGHLVTVGQFDDSTGRATLPVSVFDDGRYYLAVSGANIANNTGTYILESRLRSNDVASTDDILGDTRSGIIVKPGQPVAGRIDYAEDHDWIKASLQAGKVYVLDILADGNGAGGTLKDARLRLIDANGDEVAFDDNSGAGLDSHIQFAPNTSGDYYLDVSSNGIETGTYTARVRELYSGINDPLKSAQWYLPALGLDALKGQLTGAGIKVGMIDDGIDTAHPDLQGRIDFSLSFDTATDTKDGKHKTILDFHGTPVAGIIVGEQNNETGIVGIAPDAEIASIRVNWSMEAITQALGLQHQFAVSNNSWGARDPFADNFNSTALTFAHEALRTGVEEGRQGKGTVFVFSAGNSRATGDNTNYHNFQNAREVITVAAANQDGSSAEFSTPGASILVGSYGVDLLTTDRHEPKLGLKPASSYTTFSGTSAAAPVVSGVVALMLEANPALGYRDVQQILAYSASHPDNQDWKTNAATNWNLGGLKYNDNMGFGLVDAYAAVRLAETWTAGNTSINEVNASARAFGLNLPIPDGTDEALSKSFTIDSKMSVEHIELGVDLRHTRMGDLVVEVTSPNGTVSTLMDRPTVNAEMPFGLSGTDSGVPTHLLWNFSSTQFWGEEATGTWTVTVKDVRAEETGTLSSLSLRVYGAREDGNDTYVFTEEGFKEASSSELQDETGTDVINAAAMNHDLYVDLAKGFIAAESVTHNIASWTVIENAISGTGNDKLVGNDVNNLLNSQEGDDTLQGGLGNDTLIGGDGRDTAIYAGSLNEYGLSWNPDSKVLTVVDNKISNGNEGTDVLQGIERLVFADGDLSLAATVGNKAPIVNKSFFTQPVTVAKGLGIDLSLPDNAFTDPDAEALAVTASNATGGELPDWLSYDPVTRKFIGVPPTDWQGQLKVLVSATDGFGVSSSDILTFQFGDNQPPTVDTPNEKSIAEDAGLVALGITAPVDPEGKTVLIKILDIPTIGAVLNKDGNIVQVGDTLSGDALSELHYQTTADQNGDAGYLRYQAVDQDNVIAESSVHVFIDAINDAPRFATDQGKLIIRYPEQKTVNLDMATPTDPESAINTVQIVDLPAMGGVELDGHSVIVNQVLTLDQLHRLNFTLSENLNGPIGFVGIKATDPQGLSTVWNLSLEVQGETYSNVGTAGADAMYGSIGNDTLYGMAGNDTLVGNAGDDRLLGGIGNDTVFGGSGNDILDGSSGNDYLDGGTGKDTLSGGPGNDTYFVDDAGDVVYEVISGGAGGKDLIVTQLDLTASDNIENLQAVTGFAINLTGNALDNILSGNELNNTLSGASGRDTLIGGAGSDTLDGGSDIDRLVGGSGDDIYQVDSRSDVVVELANEGNDTVRASSSYTLSSNIENLLLAEGGDYTGGGNSLNNHIVGNSGNNILAGGLGADTLEGGDGNDVYVLSDSLDTLIDTGGVDTIRSNFDITLNSAMENAELVGINDSVATGNRADNLIIGNLGDNILEGLAGIDTLTGGDGSDQFVLAYNGDNALADQITDFSAANDLLVVDISSFGIDPSISNLSASGVVASGSFVKGVGVSALDPNDYFLLDTARGVLLFDPDGSGNTEPMDMVRMIGTDYGSMTGNNIFIAV